MRYLFEKHEHITINLCAAIVICKIFHIFGVLATLAPEISS